MKILVLGSEGFIGGNAVKFFLSHSFRVISADIVLKSEPDYILINPETPDFASLFRENLYDVCINATGAANVQFSYAYPHIDFVLNTSNVYSILDAIRLYNPNCAFINLSSAAVYGNPVKLPITEDDDVNPLSPYGLHKYYSELICTEFYNLFGIKTISLRVFSAYGPGLKKQLFWDLYNKVRNTDIEVQMFGTGRESRDFIYIHDLLAAISHIILKSHFTGSTINVGSGIDSTIEDAVVIFLREYDNTLKVKFSGESKIGDPLNWKADISVLKSLGYVPKYSLEQGIKETLQWLKRQD